MGMPGVQDHQAELSQARLLERGRESGAARDQVGDGVADPPVRAGRLVPVLHHRAGRAARGRAGGLTWRPIRPPAVIPQNRPSQPRWVWLPLLVVLDGPYSGRVVRLPPIMAAKVAGG